MHTQRCGFNKTEDKRESVFFKYLAKVSGHSRDKAASHNGVTYLNCGADFIKAELSR
jgi:hypothetical protein